MLNEVKPIFLGICQKAQLRRASWDMLGLGSALFCPFFPQTLEGCALAIAMPNSDHRYVNGFRFVVQEAANPENAAEASFFPRPVGADNDSAVDRDVVALVMPQVSIGTELPLQNPFRFATIPAPPLHLRGPGRFNVIFIEGSETTQTLIGSFDCGFNPPLPISEAERRAIMSRPSAVRFIHLHSKCGKCGDILTVYERLDPASSPGGTNSSDLYIGDAPNSWTCSCKHVELDLTFAKKGLFDLFRRARLKGNPSPDYAPLYESGAIGLILVEYEKLISRDLPEEVIQEFLESHPILWTFLSPVRILHKPCVLTKHRADFAILTSNRTLYLIEIEKPQTKLVKKGGGVHAELQAGLDQIRLWRLVVEDHRSALLSELQIQPTEVDAIKFLLVAGRSQSVSNLGMSILRRNSVTGVDLYSFDELSAFLHRVSEELEWL